MVVSPTTKITREESSRYAELRILSFVQLPNGFYRLPMPSKLTYETSFHVIRISFVHMAFTVLTEHLGYFWQSPMLIQASALFVYMCGVVEAKRSYYPSAAQILGL
jgi:hypothetical protein